MGKKQKKGRLFRFVRNLVVAMIVLFVILMLLPDDEETGNAGETVSEKEVTTKGDGTDPVTVFVYMNGSDRCLLQQSALYGLERFCLCE